MTANERRAEIMRILTVRRRETMRCLADELGVTDRTIRNDINILTSEFPVDTIRGSGGGVKVADWYHPHKHILTAEEQTVLMQLLSKSDLYQQGVVTGIITTLGSPAAREQLQSYLQMPVKITVKELSQLRHLSKEIKQDERSLKGNNPSVSTTLEIEKMIERKKQSRMVEYNRLMRYISSVDDSFMRQILTLRYVNGCSWLQVAMRIGGGNTEDSVRMAHKRFLEKQK